MNNETRALASDTTGTRGPSRRTLVRTAAWSVPVISTVAAAPAFAAASDTLAFTGDANWNKKDVLNVGFSVVNNSPNDPALTLEINLTYAPVAAVTLPSPGAWTLVAGSPAGSVKLICSSVVAGGTSPFTLRFTYGTSTNRTVTVSGTVKTASAFVPQTVNLVPSINSSN